MWFDEWLINHERQSMTTLSKILLAVSVTGFAAGAIIDFGGVSVMPQLTVALPLGAVFFGLFMIAFMMQKEMAKFDEEESKKLQLDRRDMAAPAPAQKAAMQPSGVQFKERALLHGH